MRRVLTFLFATLIGLGTGIYSALSMSGLLPSDTASGAGMDIDGWKGDLSLGTADTSPYLRARVARHGLLALAKSEAVYFVRDRDGRGRRLDENCDYRLSGGTFSAGWWSITLYDEQNFLPANTDGALSFDASRADEERWTTLISAQKPAETKNWVSSRNADQFDLTLRLYMPSKDVLDRPNEIDMPKIERLECRENPQ